LSHKQSAAPKALSVALKFLSSKARSASEVRTRLREKGFGPEEIKKVLERLAAEKLLDDEAYARSAVESLSAQRLWGPKKIALALRRRGVDDETISRALGSLGEDADGASRAFKKWLRVKGVKLPLDGAGRLRAARHLASRGFSGRAISDAIGAGEDCDFE
jgi:regulatory protein